MEDKRIARALNLLGEDANLFSADSECLLNLISKYFNDHTTEGDLQPSLLSHLAISSSTHEYSHQDSCTNQDTIMLNNKYAILDDDGLGPVEDHGQTADKEPDD